MPIPDDKITEIKVKMSEFMRWTKRPMSDIEIRNIFEKVVNE